MVFCRSCGREIHQTAVSCPHCGAVQSVTLEKAGTLWLPMPALIMGIFAVLVLFDESVWDKDTYIGFIAMAITSIVLSGFGMAVQEKAKGMSIAGLILGIIGLVGLIGRSVN